MNWKKTLLICIGILLLGGGITTLIFLTEPTASRSGATKETAMLVETTPVEFGNFQPTVVVTGTVQAAEDILLSPRISGQVTDISPAFFPGGIVRKGQTLLQIDPTDFRNTVQLRKSDLKQTEAELLLEQGRQQVARRDYRLLNDTSDQINKDLVLRRPQLQSVRARVEAAEAALGQAEINLERTEIKAPFAAQIISRSANVGSQVSPTTTLARLVGTNEYWIMANVPLSQLNWLSFSGNPSDSGTPVKIRKPTAWPDGSYRNGRLKQLLGALEEQTRLARVIISVSDPLSLRHENRRLPPLILGTFVEAHIQAKTIENAFRVSRDHLRKEDTVWLMEDDQLRIRKVQILFQDRQYAYVEEGLKRGDRIVTTNLSTVVDGAKLRTEKSTTDTSSTAQHYHWDSPSTQGVAQ